MESPSKLLTTPPSPHVAGVNLHWILDSTAWFQWTFLIAEVSQPTLGADFLQHFCVLVDLATSCLVDTETSFAILAQAVADPG